MDINMTCLHFCDFSAKLDTLETSICKNIASSTTNWLLLTTIQLPPAGVAAMKNCFKCHQPGHISSYCSTVDCKRCGKYGHWAKDCRSERMGVQNGGKGVSVRYQVSKGESISCVSVCSLLLASDFYQWFLDLAATKHMTPQRGLFESFVPLQGRVNFGKGSSAVEGKGTLLVRLSDKNEGCMLRMKNVLFVPDLKFNLVSVGKLTENDVTMSFMTDRAEGVKNDMLVFTAYQRSGLFVLESADVMLTDKNDDGMAMMTELETEDDDVMEAIALKSVSNGTWHRRLGHVHGQAIDKIPGFENKRVSSGIIHRCTVPHSPHQNGIAERYNRTIEEMMRYLLLESGMPDTFWGEAASTACQIRNLCPSSSIQDSIPAALWWNRDVTDEINRLRVFGYRAWLAQNKGKLKPRATEHVFLKQNVKGYRLYNLNSIFSHL
ncbi:hypothetical protein J437_LFUL017808 [Ladona fulva]|uniref:Uncharacterized protein n=1 Tax=Ladona fulva TaxID=123851 RepID=A0A8K0KNF1_LADFU|nr:hypothetical protein J437_LFUL017808 [Ladona fulva]